MTPSLQLGLYSVDELVAFSRDILNYLPLLGQSSNPLAPRERCISEEQSITNGQWQEQEVHLPKAGRPAPTRSWLGRPWGGRRRDGIIRTIKEETTHFVIFQPQSLGLHFAFWQDTHQS